ncbi:MAG: TIGR04282 family arsenosugar biosynthesis glycosyltransferase [Burkholderiaceae bacterium]
MTEAIIVFAREPRLGEVKRRLAAGIGEHAALFAYRRMSERCLRLAARVARERPACRLQVSIEGRGVGGDTLEARARALGALVSRQTPGSLGARMLASIREAVARGARRAILLGCDCPSMRMADLRAALDSLVDHDWVLAPTRDGGYWLIGLREPHARLFHRLPWGQATVAELTRARARALALRGLELPLREDIDDEAAWRRWLDHRASSGLPEAEVM